jgi:hypothetical protein
MSTFSRLLTTTPFRSVRVHDTALSEGERKLRNDENEKNPVGDDRGRDGDHDQRSGLDLVGDSRSGNQPARMGDGTAPGETENEVKNETESETQRMDFSATPTTGSVAHCYAGLRPDSRLAVDSEPDAVSSEQGSKVKVSARLSAPFMASGFVAPNSELLPSEQTKLLQEQPLIKLLPSEHLNTDQEQAAWLKGLLPLLEKGWWDVAANGKGFVIKQRWRDKGQQTQTYPRVSREHFETLRGMDYERARITISETIYGHVDDCIRIASKRERARCAAARLGVAH